jgi:alanine racemase
VTDLSSGARLTVALGALRENYRALARRASVPLLPMVKADAYGLGADAAVRTLADERPLAWGVATVAEGVALRAAGAPGRIVVFTPMLPATFADARAASLELVLEEAGAVAAWCALGGAWHLQVDTGMSRAGVPWHDGAALRAVLGAGAAPASIFTHFHSADVDDESMARQLARFEQVLGGLAERPACVHVANTAAIVRGVAGRWDAARPGIGLYGVDPWGRGDWTPAPVVHVTAPIVALRDIDAGESVSYCATWRATTPRRIATIAAGYADGIPRSAGNRVAAHVAGQAAPIVGVVTMDMAMLDVTGLSCAVGDEVELLGASSATVAEFAGAAQRSPYEVLTALRSRLPRTHLAATHASDAHGDSVSARPSAMVGAAA